MDDIQDLLLNFLLILIPIFLYQTFWVERRDMIAPLRNRTAIAVLSAVSVLLCMTFPLRLSPGYIYDLRLIPLLLGILYGGRRAGLFIMAMLIAYRFLLGGTGIWVILTAYPIFFAVTYWLVPRYKLCSPRRKVLIAIALATLSSLLINGTLMFLQQKPLFESKYLPLFAIFTLLHTFGMWLSIYLIENMREKAYLRLEIQRAEKLQVLGELAASLAHEIRNPMTVVRGFLQLLLEGRLDKEKEALFLHMGIEELDRSETIITNYLAFARPKGEEWVAFDVAERIAHVSGIISSYALLRGVEVRHQTEPDLIIEADPAKLSQVLVNLFKNGIEAMTGGGTLHIRAKRTARFIIIEVCDTGIGLSREETAWLKDPYFTSKEQGSGVGYTVSHQLIHAMNGTMEVTSEKGKGTCFKISLPAANDPSEVRPA